MKDKRMEPRRCPACGRMFIIVASTRIDLGMTQLPTDPDEPITRYTGELGESVAACPSCLKEITSKSFPASGKLIPYEQAVSVETEI